MATKNHLNSSEELVLVEVSGLAHGGACVGTVIDGCPSAGKRVFIADVVPGERVRARITKDCGRYCEAELIRQETTSLNRVKPPCPYFPECGGCRLQHIALAEQRRLKRDFVEGTLRHQSGLKALEGVELIGAELSGFGYRRRLGLHVDSQGNLGFFKRKTGDVVRIERCLLAVPLLNEALKFTAPIVKKLAGVVGGVVLEEHGGRAYLVLKLAGRETKNLSFPALWEELRPVFSELLVLQESKTLFRAGGESQLPFGHFSQVNEEANQLLIDTVLARAKPSEITELYAGSGNFSISLAESGKNVAAVEIDPQLVQHGNTQARERQLSSRLAFTCSSVEKYVKKEKLRAGLVLDPPRSGARAAVQACKPGGPRDIVYVSCNPATFARDCRILADKGYLLHEVLVLDMFPQTQHVECVGILLSH